MFLCVCVCVSDLMMLAISPDVQFGSHLAARGQPDPRWILFWVVALAGLVMWSIAYFMLLPLCRPNRFGFVSYLQTPI